MSSIELPELPERYNRPGAPRPNSGAPRVAALDGLRGIAIATVVAFHAGGLPGGFLGVDLFFVLSGYLITGLLLRERDESGTVALSNFWTRRARRLFPAIIVLVGAAQLWARTHALPRELDVLNGQSVAAMFYVSNWYNILFDVGYWSVGPSHSPLNHLWSLAIEEQYYLLFPLFFAIWFARSSKRSVMKFAIVCASLAVSSIALSALLYGTLGGNRSYFGTDTRIGAILAGCALAAFVHSRGESKAAHSARSYTPGNSVIALSALAMIAFWIIMRTTTPFLYNGGFALHAIASLVLIAAVATRPASAFVKALEWRPLVWLGERSYSLYLWHWPLIVVMTREYTGYSGITHMVIVSAAIAAATIVSYELVEHPIRYSKLRGMRLVATLAVPALVVSASALAWQPEPPPQFGNEALVTPGRGGTRLMLVGDSWARNLGIALAAVDSTHRMSILNMGKGGCGIADAPRQRTETKGEFPTSRDCTLWPSTWTNTVNAVRPEIAILNVGNWDQALQDFDGTGEFVGACHPLFHDRYSQKIDQGLGILGSRGARVYIMTIRDNDARAGSGPDCMNNILREAAVRHAARGVQLLDLYAQLCSAHRCPDTADGKRVYDETGHLAPEAQRRIAVWVFNQVNEKTPPK